MKRRKLSRVLATTLAVCMLAGGVLTGCGSKSDNVNNKTTQAYEYNMGFFKNSTKETKKDIIFASVQSLGKEKYLNDST